jgi:hypothetical protein
MFGQVYGGETSQTVIMRVETSRPSRFVRRERGKDGRGCSDAEGQSESLTEVSGFDRPNNRGTHASRGEESSNIQASSLQASSFKAYDRLAI